MLSILPSPHQRAPVPARHDKRDASPLLLGKLRELRISADSVDIQQVGTRGPWRVLVTLQRSQALNALYSAERFLAPLVRGAEDHLAVPMASLGDDEVTFFWRYSPPVHRVPEAA